MAIIQRLEEIVQRPAHCTHTSPWANLRNSERRDIKQHAQKKKKNPGYITEKRKEIKRCLDTNKAKHMQYGKSNLEKFIMINACVGTRKDD